MDILEAYKFCPLCGSSSFYKKGDNKLVCQNCGYKLYQNPKIGAVAIIEDEQGHILAVRRAKNPAKGTWHLPGGFAEINETIEAAVEREVREELNIEVKAQEYLFCIPNSYIYKGIECYPLDFFIKCKIINMQDIQVDKAENTEYAFFEPTKINIEEFGLSSIKEGLRRYLSLVR